VYDAEGYTDHEEHKPFVLTRPFKEPRNATKYHIERKPFDWDVELNPVGYNVAVDCLPQLDFISQESLSRPGDAAHVTLTINAYLEHIEIGRSPRAATSDDLTWDLARVPEDAFDHLDGHMPAPVLQFLRSHSRLGDTVMLFIYRYIKDLGPTQFDGVRRALEGRPIDYAALSVAQLEELRDFTMLLGDFAQTLSALMALIRDISAEDRAAHPELLRAAPAVATCALCAAAPSAFVDPDAHRGYCADCAAHM
jgi:hypothetical protein